MRILHSSVSVVSLQTGRPGFDPRKRQMIFPLASVATRRRSPTSEGEYSVEYVMPKQEFSTWH
jgi:hypothetical protein